jgi:hypothetical protein
MRIVKIALFCSSIASVGCAGARTSVIAPSANVPVSMSRAVRDDQGVIVSSQRRKVVGTYHEERTAWNILWAAIKLTPTTDISEGINQQVAAAKGDAVTHLTVVSNHCPLNYFLFPFGIIPFWPSCASLEMKGDIIQVTDGPAAAPAVADDAAAGGVDDPTGGTP